MTSASISACEQKAVFAPLKDEAGQPAVSRCSGIDINPVRVDFGCVGNGVPVDNNRAEVGIAFKKSIPNGHKVEWVLLIERHSRPYPGMTEEIIAKPN